MRFLDKYENKIEAVPFSGCMIWTGSASQNGYGFLVRRDGSTFRVHRRVYEETYGPIPDGHVICHKCDVPSCVNPAHLFSGTHKDNARDMVQKKRMNFSNKAYGERHGLAKLDADAVRRIRTLCKEMPQKEVAAMFGIAQSNVSSIVLRKSWAWVDS